MIQIENTLISEELITENFVCNLNKCKGECCVAGDAGAPLEESELKIMETVFQKVKPYLNERGLKAIEEQGLYVIDEDGDYTTTCVEKNLECAYVLFENGITQCAFEKAYNDGIIDFKKPISCHLYPIRITKYETFEALNYDRWSICSDACHFGNSLKVPVYQFLKEPLIRKYGENWYNQLQMLVE